MARSWFWLQGFPMRGASAYRATHRSECLVTLDVFLGALRMTGDLDGSELVVRPQAAQTSAEGTVAACGLLRGRRQLDRDGAAVASSYKHDAPADD